MIVHTELEEIARFLNLKDSPFLCEGHLQQILKSARFPNLENFTYRIEGNLKDFRNEKDLHVCVKELKDFRIMDGTYRFTRNLEDFRNANVSKRNLKDFLNLRIFCDQKISYTDMNVISRTFKIWNILYTYLQKT